MLRHNNPLDGPQLDAAFGVWIARALGKDVKGILSVVLYAVAIVLAAIDTRLSQALYVAVAVIWIVPDRRMERAHDA